ncbi:hypothetical protein [Fictibacillus barbaricus]|uniref:Uncharacterized protein n=1 Tax=Fictibacillus barbaricus TaxID=182136 RepID=A0ABS2Z8P2_9BACL|nr:hypothetical protein [Fictibacillus barbaricus]MBN3543912.1 hypothetical protein [Fictibacillus barbaricus]GGB71666.1 hypothetical protein GCM10007199_42350 [Fictibacillus barbaricus]
MNYFKRNEEIRRAKGSIPNWIVAEKLGIHENSYYRLLRKKLSVEKKEEILDIIEQLKRDQEGE